MAFPVNGLLDTFIRGVIENPLSNGGTWTTGWTPGGADTPFQVFGDLAVGTGGGINASYWSAATFGPDCEVYLSCATASSWTHRLVARMTNPGTSYTGYQFDMAGGPGGVAGWQLYRVTSGGALAIASGSQELQNGDAYGMALVGSIITLYYKASAGAWGAIGTIDETGNGGATGSGYIGMSITNVAADLNGFGGGTLISASAPTFTGGAPAHLIGRNIGGVIGRGIGR